MSKETILILISVLSTPLLGAVVSSYFSRKKTSAETHNINVTGEIQVAQIYKDYALQQQKDKEELRKEFIDKINELKADHKREIELMKLEFLRITKAKDDRIGVLESKVDELQGEVAKYKNMSSTIDVAKDAIHTAVDVAAEQIKNDTQ